MRISHHRRADGLNEHQSTRPAAANSDTPTHAVGLDLSAHADIIDSPTGRGVLRYLIRCAFDGSTEATVPDGDEPIALRGSVGLAPAWAHRALNTQEQRWVSACLYALTNKFGKTVQVSLRARHPKLDANAVSEAEQRTFTLHEGGFFGNFFADQPTAYACQGDGVIENPAAPVFQVRMCAIPASMTGPNGKRISECGFVLSGRCSATSSIVTEGAQYDEIVHVYLRPD